MRVPGYHRSVLQRVLSLGVAVCLLVTPVENVQAAQAAAPPERAAFFPADPREIKVPANIGSLEEAHQGDERLVILVQDAHSIPSAQRNIRNLIDFFQQTHGLETVAVEGARTELDPQIFRSFPDREKLKSVFSQYLEAGELTGTTFAAIFNPREAVYRDIEDWPLFEEGYGLYLSALERTEETGRILEAMEKDLEREKEREYSPELLLVDRSIRSFRAHSENLMEVLETLASVKAPEAGSEIALMLEENAKTDESRMPLEIEVKSISEKVRRYFQSHPSSGGSDTVSEFNEKLQAYKTSRITAEQFAVYLKDLAREMNFPVKFSGDFQSRVKKQMKMEDIDGTRFFDSFEQYAASVKESLLRSEAERRLEMQTERLYLLERLKSLELTREQWHKLKNYARRGQFSGPNHIFLEESDLERLMPEAPLRGLLDVNLLFYENAERRDEVFAANLEKILGASKSPEGSGGKAVMLVAGGFHTEGVLSRLKEKGISYLLLMPKVEALPETPHYKDHMRGLVSWRDYFESEPDGEVNVYNAFVRATRDRLRQSAERSPSGAGEDPWVLKEWRDQIVRDLSAKGKAADAARYTRFIDEAVSKSGRAAGETSLLRKADLFIEGLKKLEADGKLTEMNILGLLRPASIAASAPTNALSRKPLRMNGVRRSVQARPKREAVSSQQTALGRSELRASADNPVAGFMRAAGEKILSIGEFESFKERFFSSRTVGRGTYEPGEAGYFLYDRKPAFTAGDTDTVSRYLQVLRYLTEKGIFYPGTLWGAYQEGKSEYQVFAVSPRAAAVPGGAPLAPSAEAQDTDTLLRRPAGMGEADWYDKIFEPGSHVLKWFHRIEPGFDANVEGGNVSENSLAFMLNFAEASHSDNWGWAEDGRLYPVDIEVVTLNAEAYAKNIDAWLAEQRSELRSEEDPAKVTAPAPVPAAPKAATFVPGKTVREVIQDARQNLTRYRSMAAFSVLLAAAVYLMPFMGALLAVMFLVMIPVHEFGHYAAAKYFYDQRHGKQSTDPVVEANRPGFSLIYRWVRGVIPQPSMVYEENQYTNRQQAVIAVSGFAAELALGALVLTAVLFFPPAGFIALVSKSLMLLAFAAVPARAIAEAFSPNGDTAKFIAGLRGRLEGLDNPRTDPAAVLPPEPGSAELSAQPAPAAPAPTPAALTIPAAPLTDREKLFEILHEQTSKVKSRDPSFDNTYFTEHHIETAVRETRVTNPEFRQFSLHHQDLTYEFAEYLEGRQVMLDPDLRRKLRRIQSIVNDVAFFGGDRQDALMTLLRLENESEYQQMNVAIHRLAQKLETADEEDAERIENFLQNYLSGRMAELGPMIAGFARYLIEERLEKGETIVFLGRGTEQVQRVLEGLLGPRLENYRSQIVELLASSELIRSTSQEDLLKYLQKSNLLDGRKAVFVDTGFFARVASPLVEITKSQGQDAEFCLYCYVKPSPTFVQRVVSLFTYFSPKAAPLGIGYNDVTEIYSQNEDAFVSAAHFFDDMLGKRFETVWKFKDGEPVTQATRTGKYYALTTKVVDAWIAAEIQNEAGGEAPGNRSELRAADRNFYWIYASEARDFTARQRRGDGALRSYLNRHREQWAGLNQGVIPYLVKNKVEAFRAGLTDRKRLVLVSLGPGNEELPRNFYEISQALIAQGENPDEWELVLTGLEGNEEVYQRGLKTLAGEQPLHGELKRPVTGIQDPYPAQVVAYLNEHRESARKSMSLSLQNVFDPEGLRRGIPEDADLIFINHVLRDFVDSGEAAELARSLSEVRPGAFLVVGDLPALRPVLERNAAEHLFEQLTPQAEAGASAGLLPQNRTVYFFGYPAEYVNNGGVFLEGARSELRAEEGRGNLKTLDEENQIQPILNALANHADSFQRPDDETQLAIWEFLQKRVLLQRNLYGDSADLAAITGLFQREAPGEPPLIEKLYPGILSAESQGEVVLTGPAVAVSDLGFGQNRFAYTITVRGGGKDEVFYAKVDNRDIGKKRDSLKNSSTYLEMKNQELLEDKFQNVPAEERPYAEQFLTTRVEIKTTDSASGQKGSNRWVQYGRLVEGRDLEKVMKALRPETPEGSSAVRLYSFSLGEMAGKLFFQTVGANSEGWFFGDMKAANVALAPAPIPKILNIDSELLLLPPEQFDETSMPGAKSHPLFRARLELAQIPFKVILEPLDQEELSLPPSTASTSPGTVSEAQVANLFLAGFLLPLRGNENWAAEAEAATGLFLSPALQQAIQEVWARADTIDAGRAANFDALDIPNLETDGDWMRERLDRFGEQESLLKRSELRVDSGAAAEESPLQVLADTAGENLIRFYREEDVEGLDLQVAETIARGAAVNFEDFLEALRSSIENRLGFESDKYRRLILEAMRDIAAKVSEAGYAQKKGIFVLSPSAEKAELNSAQVNVYKDALAQASGFIDSLYYRFKDNTILREAVREAGIQHFQPVSNLSSIRVPEDVPALPLLTAGQEKQEARSRLPFMQIGIFYPENFELSDTSSMEEAFAVFMQFVFGYVAQNELSRSDFEFLNQLQALAAEAKTPDAVMDLYDQKMTAEGSEKARARVERIKAALIQPLTEILGPAAPQLLGGLELGSPGIVIGQIAASIEAYEAVRKSA